MQNLYFNDQYEHIPPEYKHSLRRVITTTANGTYAATDRSHHHLHSALSKDGRLMYQIIYPLIYALFIKLGSSQTC